MPAKTQVHSVKKNKISFKQGSLKSKLNIKSKESKSQSGSKTTPTFSSEESAQIYKSTKSNQTKELESVINKLAPKNVIDEEVKYTLEDLQDLLALLRNRLAKDPNDKELISRVAGLERRITELKNNEILKQTNQQLRQTNQNQMEELKQQDQYINEQEEELFKQKYGTYMTEQKFQHSKKIADYVAQAALKAGLITNLKNKITMKMLQQLFKDKNIQKQFKEDGINIADLTLDDQTDKEQATRFYQDVFPQLKVNFHSNTQIQDFEYDLSQLQSIDQSSNGSQKSKTSSKNLENSEFERLHDQMRSTQIALKKTQNIPSDLKTKEILRLQAEYIHKIKKLQNQIIELAEKTGKKSIYSHNPDGSIKQQISDRPQNPNFNPNSMIPEESMQSSNQSQKSSVYSKIPEESIQSSNQSQQSSVYSNKSIKKAIQYAEEQLKELNKIPESLRNQSTKSEMQQLQQEIDQFKERIKQSDNKSQISDESQDINRQRMALGLIEAEQELPLRLAEQARSQQTQETISQQSNKSNVQQELQIFGVLNQSMSKSEKMALSKRSLQSRQNNSYASVPGGNNGGNMSSIFINRINNESSAQNSSVMAANQSIRTQINNGVIPQNPNPLAHNHDISDSISAITHRSVESAKRLGLSESFIQKLELIKHNLQQRSRQSVQAVRQLDQNQAQLEQAELSRQSQGQQVSGAGISNAQQFDVIAGRDQQLSDQTRSLNATINSSGYQASLDSLINKTNLTSEQAELARQSLSADNIIPNLIANSFPNDSFTSSDKMQATRQRFQDNRPRGPLPDSENSSVNATEQINRFRRNIPQSDSGSQHFDDSLNQSNQYAHLRPRIENINVNDDEINNVFAQFMQGNQNRNRFNPPSSSSSDPSSSSSNSASFSDSSIDDLLVADNDLSLDFASEHLSQEDNPFNQWADFANRANKQPRVQGDPNQPSFKMPKVAITGKDLARYMVQAVKFISEISGPISSVILATYKKQTSVFKAKVEKKETTNFKVKPGSMFRLRTCD